MVRFIAISIFCIHKKGNIMKKETKELLKKILITLAISCVLPMFIFFSTPFDIYAANYDEFVFSFSNYFWACFGYFIAGTAICFLILFFLPKKAYRIVAGLFLGLSFLMFIQSSFLNGKLSTLKGDGEGNTTSLAWMIANIVIWAVVLALFMGIASIMDKKGIVSTIGLVITAVLIGSQIIIPVSASISHGDMFLSYQERQKRGDNEYQHMLLTNKNLTTAGKEGNIFVFCVDRMDEDWLEYIYKTEPSLFDDFKGFTWFQDHTSRYGHTYPSIVTMLTEKPFLPETQTKREKFLNEAFKDAHGLETLHNEGWKINIYSEKFYTYNDAFYLPEYFENRAQANVYNVTNAGLLGLKMAELGLYRTMPFFLKDALSGVNSDTFSRAIQENDPDGNDNYQSSINVLDKWTDEKSFSKVDGKGFYFIHTEGLHSAYSAKESVSLFKENMKIINKYLSFLKQENLFEDATIIITGDHGSGSAYDWSGLTDSIRTAMFIKPAGIGEEEMKISQAQTSHDQLWATILEQANAENGADFGMSILETPEGVDQEREFVWHTYNCPLYEYRYAIHGSAKNFENWELTKETYYGWRITD